MSHFAKIAAVIATTLVGTTAHGAIAVAPTTIETGGVSTVFRQLPRAYQSVIFPTQLGAFGAAPVTITGIQFRLAAGATNGIVPVTDTSFPVTAITFANFGLQLSEGSAAVVTDGEILSSATTFAANQAGTITTVRSGPLTIDPASFPNNPAATPGAPNAFGPVISFTTPYVYTPGTTLAYSLTHSGYGVSVAQPFFATASFANGVADAVSSTAATITGNLSDFTQAPNAFTLPYIVQFVFEPIPEPTTLALLAATGAFAIRRRRA